MPRPKILLVDDEPYNLDYLEQELEESNYEVITAGNGRDGLEKVQSESPDLVLLDIMMPVMDGFEVLSCMKGDASTRDIPVIVISASNDLESVVKGIQLGAEDYLPKPFEPTLLHARITSGLEKKRLRDLQQLYLKGLERELDIGREIQQGFLPADLPNVAGWGIAAYFKAAREVAGDFYDAFYLPDGKLTFVVGDVCGKGVGAALFMTLFRSLIRVTSTTGYYPTTPDAQVRVPVERLQHVISFTNTYIVETHGESDMFATIFIGILDPEEGLLTYINCGNEPPLLVKKGGTLTPLAPSGPVVGVIPEASFAVKEVEMDRSDLLLVFTDGITDAINSDNISFGSQRLPKLLREGSTTPGSLLKSIVDQLHQFIGAAEQFDDITLLAIQRLAGDAGE